LPDDWSIGVADIVESTKAIAEARYKAVNMAGASVIAAVANALEGREFPFVFGGDGASFAVSPDDLARTRDALAATAIWVEESLNLMMRVRWFRSQPFGHRVLTSASPASGRRRICLMRCFPARPRLGRNRDETRRVRGAGGGARDAARSDRAFVPV